MRRLALLIPINKERKILLQHRENDAPRKPDHWAFFGGHIEENETPEEAAKREFKEELQIEDVNLKFWKKVITESWCGNSREKLVCRAPGLRC